MGSVRILVIASLICNPFSRLQKNGLSNGKPYFENVYVDLRRMPWESHDSG